MSFLYSKNFLEQLDKHPHKVKYVRITAQDYSGMPTQRLEGIATGGSISLDGKSKQQRTCSLTLLVDKESVIINNKYWALQTQFILEIGLLNEIDSSQDKIIWFKQGVFVIDSFSYQINSGQISVSIGGKDKLSKLDGTIGGKLGSVVVFDTIKKEIVKNEDYDFIKIPIYDIIYNAMIQYGQETPENIIIKDLTQQGYELWEYCGEDPMYIIVNDLDQVVEIIFSGGGLVYVEDKLVALQDIEQYYVLNPMFDNTNFSATKVKLDEEDTETYHVVQIVSGQAVGYHETELIYAQELQLEENNTVVDLLDKIVQELGPIPYEYFYNEEGQFVFQQQQYYLKNILNTDPTSLLAEPIAHAPEYAYKFNDLSLIMQIGANPSIQNIKNDYILYGEYETGTGQTITTHIRYVIDNKPTHPYTSLTTGKQYDLTHWDWRELIYQMADDFYKRDSDIIGGEEAYYTKLQEKNPWCINGKTGYEAYYTDLKSFWRDLYDPTPSADKADRYFKQHEKHSYWNKDIVENPSGLAFWFDFLDTKGEWDNISIKKIGRRAQVNSGNFQRIYNQEIPELQFILENETPNQNNAYQDINLPRNYEDYFRLSAQSNSGLTVLANDLNNYTNQADTMNITAVPIYYLKPNSRIYIKDFGDYMINTINFDLSFAGTMSLQLSKINSQFVKEVV